MANRRFDTFFDYQRFKANLHLRCSRCPHCAILDPGQLQRWAIAWRWNNAIESGLMRHFRCSRCGARWPRPSPTTLPVTPTDFFPDEHGWQRLHRRLR